MAEALKGSVKFTLSATQIVTGTIGGPTDNLNLSETFSFASTGASTVADVLWYDQRTLSNGANETLDLTASLTNAFGTAVTLDNVSIIFIRNLSEVNTLRIGGAASNAFPLFAATNDILILPAKGTLMLGVNSASGLDVGASDQLKLANGSEGGASLIYDIVLVGGSITPTPTPTPTP